MLLACPLLITALKTTGTLLATHPELLSGSLHYLIDSEKTVNQTFHQRLEQVKNEGQIVVTSDNQLKFTYNYDQTFSAKLEKILTYFFPENLAEIQLISAEVLEKCQLPADQQNMYELHKIYHSGSELSITTLRFSPVQSQHIWHFYFFDWGSPYVNLEIIQKKLDWSHFTEANSILSQAETESEESEVEIL